jgi:hypothetical protein
VITDAELPEGLQLVDGSMTATFDKINPGSSKKISYIVVATKGDTPMMLANAQVSYKAEADASEATTGTSSFTGFYVITPTQEIVRHALTVVRAGHRRGHGLQAAGIAGAPGSGHRCRGSALAGAPADACCPPPPPSKQNLRCRAAT